MTGSAVILRCRRLSTLELFLEYAAQLKSAGKNLALMIMDYTVRQYGYESLDTAEAAIDSGSKL